MGCAAEGGGDSWDVHHCFGVEVLERYGFGFKR